jgi:hypothetical protein
VSLRVLERRVQSFELVLRVAVDALGQALEALAHRALDRARRVADRRVVSGGVGLHPSR